MSKKVPVEVYSRVVGYYRPVKQWNKGKRSEFDDRKEFDVKKKGSDLKNVEVNGLTI